MVVAPLAGMLAGRIGVRLPLVTGLTLQAASLVWFAVLTESTAGYAAFVPALALAGIGMGLTFAPSATAVLDGQPEDDFAVASSANATVREFGVALGVSVLAAVFLANGGVVSPAGFEGAVGPALVTGAAMVAVGIAAAAAAPGRRSIAAH
jgi:MFS family permease